MGYDPAPLRGLTALGSKLEGPNDRRATASGGRTRCGRRTGTRQETPRTRTGRVRRRLPRSGSPAGKGARLRRRAVGAGGSSDERFEQKRHAAGGEPGGKQPRPTSVNANENVQRPRTDRARQRAAVFQGLEGVWQAARRKATGKFTSLLHHLTPELPRGSFYALKRQAAAGAGGVRWREYESGLEDRLEDLDSGVQRGAYRAQSLLVETPTWNHELAIQSIGPSSNVSYGSHDAP